MTEDATGRIIQIPDFALVLLYGPSGVGKSTFARRHFKPGEILSSDGFREMICDDENNQEVSAEAFEVLHMVLKYRLAQRRFTVVDATNLLPESRRPLLDLAKRKHCPVFGIVLQLPLKLLQRRRRNRKNRQIPAAVVRQQFHQSKQYLKQLKNEGLRKVYELEGRTAINEVAFQRVNPWLHCMNDEGPFDIIGDVHGCYDELCDLILKLGYAFHGEGDQMVAIHPEGRKLVFVGDLVDRGPKTPDVIRLVMACVEKGLAYCAPGNHDIKLWRKLCGNAVSVRHGLEMSLEQLEAEPTDLSDRFRAFCESLPSHFILDKGALVVVHAGIRPKYIQRESRKIWSFALYGDVSGKLDSSGFPIRENWAEEHDGEALVVYGHTPTREPEWENNTICIDTGCVFGHRLTALRYPEKVLESVPARKEYYPKSGPFALDIDVDNEPEEQNQA